MNLSSQPVRSCSKEWQTRGLRNKPTQRQMGSISPKVDKQLKERSDGICELCTAAKAVQRAHITGRKQIDHRTKVRTCCTCVLYVINGWMRRLKESNLSVNYRPKAINRLNNLNVVAAESNLSKTPPRRVYLSWEVTK